jgi:ElaB/YqjD/DUF883 family membrane-anchored ribosome-binding protein
MEQTEGGAGPAIAAHSKDASAPGATSASSTPESAPAGPSSVSDTISGVAGQAREAAGRLGASVTDAAATASQSLADKGGRAADQTATFVREQPIVALAVTGAVCLAIGILLGRR